MTPPMPMPAMMRIQVSTLSGAPMSVSVVPMASAMPIMPNVLPCRDVAGLDRPRSARMNSTPEAR